MESTTLVESAPMVQTPAKWSLVSRIAFRFCFAYLVLFCLSGQIISSVLLIPKIYIPGFANFAPVRAVIFWVAAHLFGMKLPLVYSGSGSGDKRYDWVGVFCILVVAVLATLVWSIIDRRRENYRNLHRWFLLFLRISLVGQMLVYGFIKVFPLQMSYPGLSRLVEQFGDFSPMDVLWSSVGAAPVYETLTGCAELLGGLLLMFPRTVTLGALVCLADMMEVFLLNMTYDVPVKLLSFHLMLISLVLLAPDMKRLMNFFVLNRPTEAVVRAPLFQSQRIRRMAAGALAFFWIWMVGINVFYTIQNWQKFGPNSPRPPLYGIWDVKEYTLDGKPQPLLLTNALEWRGIVFDNPHYAEVLQMVGSRGFGLDLDPHAHFLTLTAKDDKHWQARFGYTQSGVEDLTLDGTINGHSAILRLHREDETKLMIESRGFHWVQDYPFVR